MAKIEIFDPALCCSTGVCGPEVDQSLVIFAADVDRVTSAGGAIRRYNLAQEPLAFAQNSVVSTFLSRSGQESLPLILVDGEIALAGRYPSREQLARWAGVTLTEAAPVAKKCCPGSSC
ncbi:arsenite efflux transporter metallochaperone ArsD [Candidatus Magnetaquicoccus inordinatus]|uniref:arsenite efflux transporter metallochaperone ArsD n=1 Tax=Candidatus Magnetaquicoccus inordinatus TaxID=2496818 RepID=UPI00102BC39E|nr:arsenite efflux transporter metallochaperone ArsD [Candidatus Magnetaquicoccus inordinatus]